jgi:hypothetical protein
MIFLIATPVVLVLVYMAQKFCANVSAEALNKDQADSWSVDPRFQKK